MRCSACSSLLTMTLVALVPMHAKLAGEYGWVARLWLWWTLTCFTLQSILAKEHQSLYDLKDCNYMIFSTFLESQVVQLIPGRYCCCCPGPTVSNFGPFWVQVGNPKKWWDESIWNYPLFMQKGEEMDMRCFEWFFQICIHLSKWTCSVSSDKNRKGRKGLF